MKSVRLGIIGLGNIGPGHAENIESGKVSRCELAAVSAPNVLADDLAKSIPR
jgi:hypothetical protein